MKLRSADGSNLGKVVACQEDTFLIEKGLFFPKDYQAGYREVAEIRDGEIWLGGTDAQLRTGRYDEGTGISPGARQETRVPLSEEELIAEKRAQKTGEVRVRKEVVTEHQQISVPVTKEEVHVERVPVSGETRAAEGSFQKTDVSVPVYEEEVEIRKRPVVREEVRVAKTSHEEEQRVAADVRKEKVDIEKEGAVRYGTPDDPTKRHS
jgi:uncharacterized protein (TIGR02271 family)